MTNLKQNSKPERFSCDGERRPLACGVRRLAEHCRGWRCDLPNGVPFRGDGWSSPSRRRRHAGRVRSPVNRIVPAKIVQSNGGFSLIEVCVAVGVVIVGFVGVLGMLINGIQSSRTAAENCIPAMIADDIFNQLNANYCGYYQSVVLSPNPTNIPIATKDGTASAVFTSGDPYSAQGPIRKPMFYDINGRNVTPFPLVDLNFASPPLNGYYRVWITYADALANANPALNNRGYRVQATVWVIWPAISPARTNVFVSQIVRKYN